eukprot:1158459-Pelagomonas_calceolata.AAC.1
MASSSNVGKGYTCTLALCILNLDTQIQWPSNPPAPIKFCVAPTSAVQTRQLNGLVHGKEWECHICSLKLIDVNSSTMKPLPPTCQT